MLGETDSIHRLQNLGGKGGFGKVYTVKVVQSSNAIDQGAALWSSSTRAGV